MSSCRFGNPKSDDSNTLHSTPIVAKFTPVEKSRYHNLTTGQTDGYRLNGLIVTIDKPEWLDEFRLLLGQKSPPATKPLRIAEAYQKFLGIDTLPNCIDGTDLKNLDRIL
jgi:hypothetical protein